MGEGDKLMAIVVYIKRLLQLSFLFIVFISHASANNNFEFGVLNNQNCIEQSCTITFENTYTSPLVFLFSSFDTANYTTDVSSTLFLESVSSTNATIRQKTRVYEQSEQIQMLSIQYVVVEEGKIVLDPTQPTMLAEAGVISGVAYIGKKVKHKHKKWLNVDFKLPFSRPPIVFTQVQGLSQTNVWATTSNRYVSPQNFETTLELGRSSIMPANDKPEKIAYLAIQDFSGITDRGTSFVVGKKENVNQKKRKGDDVGALNTLARSCLNNTISLPPSFDSNYTVLISKQTRQGADGGWLRLCEGQQNNELSFMLDEDYITREHGALETVGYLVFENKNDLFDMCEYFPSAAQTWFDGGGIETQLIVDGEKGQNRSYIETPNRTVGFPSGSMNLKSGNTCEDSDGSSGDCIAAPSLIVPHLSVTTEFTGVDGSINGLSDITISPGHYTAINLMGGNAVDYIQVVIEPGIYWVNQFSATGFAEIHFSNIEKTIIHVQNWNDPGNVIYNHEAKPDNLLIAAHGVNANILMAGSNLLKAHLYSEGNIALNGRVSVYGAVTAKTLKLFSNSRIIGQSECFDPPKNYTLKVTPQIDYSLTCERIPVKFTVEDDNGPVLGFNKFFSAVINTKDNGSACWSESPDKSVAADCSITGSTFVDGEKTLYLDSSDLGIFDVTASSDNLNEAEEEHFEFVPFKFDVNTIKVIANKSQSFDINVLACNDGSPNVVQDYNGNKQLEVSPYILDSPNSYDGIRTDLELAGQINPNQIGLTFNQGIATTNLTYGEAGSLHFALSDPSFICPPNFDCNDYPIDSGLLSTTVNVESRPWKLVVCSDVAADGNSSNGPAFVAAAEAFSLKVKPVQYSSSPNSDLCELPVTQNFFKPSAPQALITALDPTLNTPQSSIGGALGTLSPLLSFSNNIYAGSNSTSHYLFENMTYDEVGSIQFNVEASSVGFYDGIQGGIDKGYKPVGRFYPAYFSITNTLWDYPENQGSSEGTYSYMAQPFDDVNFEVTAYSYNDSIVANYGLFDTNLKASFLLTGGYNSRLNIASSDLDNTHWSNNATWETSDLSNSVIWSRKSASMLAGNVITTADGPFNEGGDSITTALSLAISGVDPVSFDKNQEAVLEQELLSQPSTRYGRMVLDSVGTAVGQRVIIPLRVEFWNGSRFVVSKTDENSHFDGAKHDKQIIWSDPTNSSASKLTGSGVVVNGVNTASLIAEPDSSNLREQVRFWLCLDPESAQKDDPNMNCQNASWSNDEQPWLQYNWRGQGDEDPSTVVTFGIYRGNDRIIFRGESNIIGTSN
jgi:MSHA biogenesis protein MshQ